MNTNSDPLLLYYYTSVPVMQSILSKGCIWATNILYMNDSEEYKNGLREIDPILNECIDASEQNKLSEYIENQLKEPRTDCYSISFSQHADLLSQWSMYAKESGVNLGFDFERLLQSGSVYNTDDPKGAMQITAFGPDEVTYFTQNENKAAGQEENEIKRIKGEIKRKLTEDQNVINSAEHMLTEGWQQHLYRHVALIKRFEFHAEAEWRLVFNATNENGRFPVKYRLDKGVLKPYVNVKCYDNQNVVSPWPIVAITVGPGYNQAVVFESIKHFLDYGQIIKLSDESILSNFKMFLHQIPESKDSPDLVELINNIKSQLHSPGFRAIVWINRITELQRMGLSDRNKETREFFEHNYFSSCGIILKRSKIPYIF